MNWKSQTLSTLLQFGCGQQQKRHAAAPPPTGVWRRMGRNRQKPVGQDKGSLTEQQTEGNSNNNDTDKEKTRQQQTRSLGSHRRRTLPSRKRVLTEPPEPPSPPEPSVMSQGMEHRALFGQVGSAPTPRLCPFLESGEN